MRIERVNDNQIRCTLTKEDLESRQLRISELAYGSEKARHLFQDMMEKAECELGFEAEDIPIMIEAVPLDKETLVLIVTKVDDPEELDSRFANYAPDMFEDEEDSIGGENPFDGCDSSCDDSCERTSESFVPAEDVPEFKRLPSSESKAKNSANDQKPFVYTFSSVTEVISLAATVGSVVTAPNSLYRSAESGTYYLFFDKSAVSLEESGLLAGVFSEFGKSAGPSAYTLGMRKHLELVIEDNALQALAKL